MTKAAQKPGLDEVDRAIRIERAVRAARAAEEAATAEKTEAAADQAEETLRAARGGTGGARPLRTARNFDWITLQVSVERNTTMLFDDSRPFADQFYKESYNGFAVQAMYNAMLGGPIPSIFGAAFGWKRSTNADDLDSVEMTETRTIAGPDGTVIRTVSTTRQGLAGVFDDDVRQWTLNTDWVFYPCPITVGEVRATVAFDVFTRSGVRRRRGVHPRLGCLRDGPRRPPQGLRRREHLHGRRPGTRRRHRRGIQLLALDRVPRCQTNDQSRSPAPRLDLGSRSCFAWRNRPTACVTPSTMAIRSIRTGSSPEKWQPVWKTSGVGGPPGSVLTNDSRISLTSIDCWRYRWG